MSSAQPQRTDRALSAYAAAVLGFMILVILWGAVVRATGSGAGCGDHWPLCNGDFFPHHPRIATIIEFTHRSMSGICTVLVAVLISWTFVARPRGDRARKAAVWSGVLLITEALLGAVLVLGGYVDRNTSDMRVVVQCVHFTNTMLLLACADADVVVAARAGSCDVRRVSARSRAMAWIALALTILTGATGSVAALADTLFPSPSFARASRRTSPRTLRCWSTCAGCTRRRRCWRSSQRLCCAAIFRATGARWIGALLLLQIALGVADLIALAPVALQVLHLLGADLFWIALVASCSNLIFAERPLHAAAEAALISSAQHP